MTESLSLTCPHCGEDFPLAFDPGEGTAEFVVDCEICCRPMTVRVRVNDGEVEALDVSAD
jgi:hypothetical protein